MMSSHAKVLMGVLIAVIVFAVAVVWLATRPKTQEPEGTAEDLVGAAEAMGSASTIEAPSANPYQDVPDLNPVEQANPFRDLKTNPFAR